LSFLQPTVYPIDFKDGISHPNPSLATRLGFQQLFFTMREILLWGPLRDDVPYAEEELITELTRAHLAYLEIHEVK
jgi:hypothetical protein